MIREGILYVISAPSGAGKTSLCKEIIDIYPDLRHSVSYTTRPIRAGEVDGVDYHFVTRKEFDAMVGEGAFAEWAEVHDNCYGTALRTLEEARTEGLDILLDIDCQGAAQLKKTYHKGVFIFILPPTLSELQRRLQGRNTDSAAVIERRIANARDEIRQAEWYDYLVVNDRFETALDNLKAIVAAERCRAGRNLQTVSRLLQNR